MGNNRINLTEVKGFWDWFSQNCQKFGSNFENTILLDELDERVNKLGDFSWEVGPGRVKENLLVISPNGNLDLLQDTREIIANSIECSDWEYYYAKPPKQWDLIFDFEMSDGNQIEIDASQWTYVLLKYADGMFTIIIKGQHLKQLNDDNKLTAAEIVLDGVLGEEIRIQKICEIDVVEEFESSYQNRASNIKELPNHFKTVA
jgi:hypothetical protein